MKCVLSILLNIFLCVINAEDFEMIILHNNDMHARFEERAEGLNGAVVGGFARTATVIKEARNRASSGDGPPVLFLNAGDTYTGTIWFTVHRWKIVTEFLNALTPDAACLGNHEFDDGVWGLNPFVQSAKFPVLAANLKFGNETILAENVKPSIVLNINGRKVGIIGYVTPETKLISVVGNVDFEDEVVAVKRESQKLKKEGINIMIALGHSGFQVDKRIAKEVNDIDLVVGGHTNTFLWNGQPPDKEKPEDAYPTQVRQRNGKIVPVVQAYAYTKYMGKLHVVFDQEGTLKTFKGQPIFLNQKIHQDPELLKLLEEFRPAIDEYNQNIIGQTRAYLNAETCRTGECSFGNVLVDSMVDYVTGMYKGLYWSHVPIGIVNGGSIRLSINATSADKNVTAGDLMGAVPFHQQLISFDLLGKDLLQTLETAARSNGETSRGEFLQVSGLKVVYDFAKPTGSRVVSVKVRCGQCHVPSYSPLMPNKIYRLIATAFLLNGGDGYKVLKEKAMNRTVEEIFDVTAIQAYFNLYKIITPQEEERIIVFNLRTPETSGYRLIRSNYVNIFILIVFVIKIK